MVEFLWALFFFDSNCALIRRLRLHYSQREDTGAIPTLLRIPPHPHPHPLPDRTGPDRTPRRPPLKWGPATPSSPARTRYRVPPPDPFPTDFD